VTREEHLEEGNHPDCGACRSARSHLRRIRRRQPLRDTSSTQIKNGSVSISDLSAAARKALQGQKGETGAAGPQGQVGAQGPTGEIPLQPPFAPKHAFIQTWWLAYGDNALWATLPNYDAVVRVDAVSGQARYFQLNYGRPFGVAVGAGSAWVATDRAVVRLDEHTGAVLGAAALPTANVTGFMSIAFGYGSAWVTNYDRRTLTEVPLPPPA
jgi:hypothetical protein